MFILGASNPVEESKRSPLQPLTITSLEENHLKPSVATVAKVQESLNQSSSLSPGEVVARIEAEKLPSSLEETLSQLHIKKLKQLQYEHGKNLRREQAIKLIYQIRAELDQMEE